ncbi:hypothetical protein Pelo_9718 [Pelomyxa schiedti]|nr:hypothetical protein Pelo_9718 [Pelomyxa schiedti]
MQPRHLGCPVLTLLLVLGSGVEGQAVNGYYIQNTDPWLAHLTNLANSPDFICQVPTGQYYAGDFANGDTTKMYAIRSTDNKLLTISTTATTGTIDCSYTEIGSTGVDASTKSATGMSWCATTSTMWASFTTNTDTNVVIEGTLDLATGHFTELVSTSYYPVLDIAWDVVPPSSGETGSCMYHLSTIGRIFWWKTGTDWTPTDLVGEGEEVFPITYFDYAHHGGLSNDPTTGNLLAIGADWTEELVQIDRDCGALVKTYWYDLTSDAACLSFGPLVTSSAECLARPHYK